LPPIVREPIINKKTLAFGMQERKIKKTKNRIHSQHKDRKSNYRDDFIKIHLMDRKVIEQFFKIKG
jgi:hypothetical protein